MDRLDKEFISILKGSLCKEAATEVDRELIMPVFKLAQKRRLTCLIYNGLKNSGVEKNEYGMPEIMKQAVAVFQLSQIQLAALLKVYDAFEKEKIDYLPIKGAVIKGFYPSAEMREMSDADILVRDEQYKRAKEILTQLGYKKYEELDTVYSCELDGQLELELHKQVMPQNAGLLYDYYKDIFGRAKKQNESSCRFVLSDDDVFILLVAHIAKHCRSGGIGLKYIIDIYVLQRYFSLDMQYISKELDKMQILDFFNNLTRLISVWFDGAEEDESSKLLGDFILSTDLYGNEQRRIAAAAVRDYGRKNGNGRVRIIKTINSLFPPFEKMKKYYPVLNKAPVLLPFCSAWRLLSAPFTSRKTIAKFKKVQKNIDKRTLDEFDGLLMRIGL